jgi:hypothetical protein
MEVQDRLPGDEAARLTVSLDDIKRVLVHTETRLFRTVAKSLLASNSQAMRDLSVAHRAMLSLADWMSHLGCLSDLQIVTTLEKRRRSILEWAAFVDTHLLGRIPPPVYTLTISDGRWVHANIDKTWLDLESGEEVEALPGPAVTHITCDVLAMYLRVLSRLYRLKGGKDVADPDKDRPNVRAEDAVHAARRGAADADGRGHLRDGAAGVGD